MRKEITKHDFPKSVWVLLDRATKLMGLQPWDVYEMALRHKINWKELVIEISEIHEANRHTSKYNRKEMQDVLNTCYRNE